VTDRFAPLLCLLLLVLAGPAHADSAKDLLGVPGPVSFQNTQFDLAWTSHPTADYFKQEYLPAGQTPEHFNDMFIIEASAAATPVAAAGAKVNELKKRAASDAFVNYAVIGNKATGEIILDFILSDNSTGTLTVEWNAYRYALLTKDGGVALYAISHRAYGDDVDKFLSDLKQSRPRTIEALANFATPALKPNP